MTLNHITDRSIIVPIPLTVVGVVKYRSNLASCLDHAYRFKFGDQSLATLYLEPRNGLHQMLIDVRHNNCIFAKHFNIIERINHKITKSIFLLI